MLINNQIAHDQLAVPINNMDSVNKSGCGSSNPFTNLIAQATANGIEKNAIVAISYFLLLHVFVKKSFNACPHTQDCVST